jgi:signal peptidase II
MTELQKNPDARADCCRAFSKRRFRELPDLTAALVFLVLLVTGLALDLWSKKAVFEWFRHRRNSAQSVSIIDGFLYLAATENAGAAFGIAQGRRTWLIAVSALALIAVLVVLFLSGSERKLVHAALGLFTAGVCGNLYDRLFNNGLVRDFIDVVYWPGKHWPTFNIADSMLCIGVGLMLISAFPTGWFARRHARQRK